MSYELLISDSTLENHGRPRANVVLNPSLDVPLLSVIAPLSDANVIRCTGGTVTFSVSSGTTVQPRQVWTSLSSSTSAVAFKSPVVFSEWSYQYSVTHGADTKLLYDRRKGGRTADLLARRTQREKNQKALQLLKKWRADQTTAETDRQSLNETIAALNKSRHSARKLFP